MNIYDYCKRIISFFYFAIFGPNVNSHLWERKTGNNLVRYYNNEKAALVAVAESRMMGYNKASTDNDSLILPRVHRVRYFCHEELRFEVI